MLIGVKITRNIPDLSKYTKFLDNTQFLGMLLKLVQFPVVPK